MPDQQSGNSNDKCGRNEKKSCGSRQSGRRGREGKDAVQRITEQRTECPLGFSCRPLYIVEWNPLCIKSYKRKDSLHIAVIFLQFQDRVGHGPVHHTEITGAVCHV